MNYAHAHLLLNHFPLATLLFGFLIFIAGRLRKNESIARVALVILIVGGFAGAAAYLTGEPAEQIVKNFPLFSEANVHEHEQAAFFGLWATIITGAVAALTFYFSAKKGSVPRWCTILLIVVNFWALTVIARVNYLGGNIFHPETRSQAD